MFYFDWVSVINEKIIFTGSSNIDYSKITNNNCGIVHEVPISTTELHIKTENIDKLKKESAPSVTVELGMNNLLFLSQASIQLTTLLSK